MQTTPDIFATSDLTARLSEVADAHHKFVDSIAADYDKVISWSPKNDRWQAEKTDVIARENAQWATWYAAYLAPRLSADVRAAQWTPAPRQSTPPFAPIKLDSPDFGQWTPSIFSGRDNDNDNG